MKFVSFNINSVRARIHQLEALVNTHQPDLIGLQETKVHDDEFPHDALAHLGYEIITHGQKGHYGVATLTRLPVLKIEKGLPGDTEDSQKRLLMTQVALPNGDALSVFNGYFPQGENVKHATKFPAKRAFYAGLHDVLTSNYSPNDNLMVMGDVNISSTDLDIGIGEDNRKRWLSSGKTSFQPEERQWMQRLLDYGLIDSYRHLHPQNTDYSWFDYRSKGFEREPRRGLRIDLILLSKSMMSKCTQVGIDHAMRAMEKPSDHCPVWSDLDV